MIILIQMMTVVDLENGISIYIYIYIYFYIYNNNNNFIF